MATEEPIVETVPQLTVPEPPASEKNEPKAQAMKIKKSKESKPKKASKPRSPSSHPTYSEMIKDAIVSLKEKNGSSQCAIAKFIEEKNKPLPSNFKKLLLQNLKKDVVSGKLAKVKASFKLSLAAKKPVVAKPKTKPASKAKKAVKAKTTAKPKAKAVVNPNVVSKAKPVTHLAHTSILPCPCSSRSLSTAPESSPSLTAGYHVERQEASDSQSTVSVTSTWF